MQIIVTAAVCLVRLPLDRSPSPRAPAQQEQSPPTHPHCHDQDQQTHRANVVHAGESLLGIVHRRHAREHRAAVGRDEAHVDARVGVRQRGAAVEARDQADRVHGQRPRGGRLGAGWGGGSQRWIPYRARCCAGVRLLAARRQDRGWGRSSAAPGPSCTARAAQCYWVRRRGGRAALTSRAAGGRLNAPRVQRCSARALCCAWPGPGAALRPLTASAGATRPRSDDGTCQAFGRRLGPGAELPSLNGRAPATKVRAGRPCGPRKPPACHELDSWDPYGRRDAPEGRGSRCSMVKGLQERFWA